MSSRPCTNFKPPGEDFGVGFD